MSLLSTINTVTGSNQTVTIAIATVGGGLLLITVAASMLLGAVGLRVYRKRKIDARFDIQLATVTWQQNPAFTDVRVVY